MKKSDFWFDLPENQIAQTPVEPRDHSRLLRLDKSSGEVSHHHFYDIVDMSMTPVCSLPVSTAAKRIPAPTWNCCFWNKRNRICGKLS